jgi:hypothetical protein
LTDSRPQFDPVVSSLSNFYREEFVRCLRCLHQQREHYSEAAITNAEQALERVMEDIDHLCTKADANQVVSRILHQFDVATGLSAWTDPERIN